MSLNLFRIHGAQIKKKAGTKAGPGIELAGCPDKVVQNNSRASPGGQPRRLSPHKIFRYAVLLGRTVKSRNWVRTLDICIPFSCETNGRISAMN